MNTNESTIPGRSERAPEPNEQVSWGTLRTGDLIEAFTDALRIYDPERAAAIRKEYTDVFGPIDAEHERLYQAGEYTPWADVCEELCYDSSDFAEQASYLVNEALFDALSDCAPEGCYFGTSEGDGSDFGFWQSEPDEPDEWGEDEDDDEQGAG
jgi:hypothetical protein